MKFEVRASAIQTQLVNVANFQRSSLPCDAIHGILRNVQWIEGFAMFTACILFALPTIKETWVNADTHPVYNSRVQAIPFGRHYPSFNEADTRAELQKVRNELAAMKISRFRAMIDRINDLIIAEGFKLEPDRMLLEEWVRLVIDYQDQMLDQIGRVQNNPDMEKMVEKELLEFQQRK